jgi:hypothetical protein
MSWLPILNLIFKQERNSSVMVAGGSNMQRSLKLNKKEDIFMAF